MTRPLLAALKDPIGLLGVAGRWLITPPTDRINRVLSTVALGAVVALVSTVIFVEVFRG